MALKTILEIIIIWH